MKNVDYVEKLWYNGKSSLMQKYIETISEWA